MPIARKNDTTKQGHEDGSNGYARLAHYLITGKTQPKPDEDHEAIQRAAARMNLATLPPEIAGRVTAGAKILQNDDEMVFSDETGIAPDPNERPSIEMPRGGSLTERTTAEMLAEASMVPAASRAFQEAKLKVRKLADRLLLKQRDWADAMDAKTKTLRAGTVANAKEELAFAVEERRLCYWKLMEAQGLNVPDGALGSGGTEEVETNGDNETDSAEAGEETDDMANKKNGKKVQGKANTKNGHRAHAAQAQGKTKPPVRTTSTVTGTTTVTTIAPPPPQEPTTATPATPRGPSITSVTREVCSDGLPHLIKDIAAAVAAAFPDRDPDKVAVSVSAYVRPNLNPYWVKVGRGMYELNLEAYAASPEGLKEAGQGK